MNEYNNLLNNLEVLKLEKMRSFLPNYLEEITNKKIGCIIFSVCNV